jgi:hypothetical protein
MAAIAVLSDKSGRSGLPNIPAIRYNRSKITK